MRTRRILIIDDETDIREIARVSLYLTNNWEVLTAASGDEGVAIAQAQQLDAILLDISMPGKDGLATLKTLKDDPATQHIPVIMLTATTRIITQHQSEHIGAKAMIHKPFDPGVLANQIETALGWNLYNAN